jgi:hypothetical protein
LEDAEIIEVSDAEVRGGALLSECLVRKRYTPEGIYT